MYFLSERYINNWHTSERIYVNAVYELKGWSRGFLAAFRVSSLDLLPSCLRRYRKASNHAFSVYIVLLILSLAACSQDHRQTDRVSKNEESDILSSLSIIDNSTSFNLEDHDGGGLYFDHSPYTLKGVNFRYVCCVYEYRVYLFCLYELDANLKIGIFRYDLSENGLYRGPNYLEANILKGDSGGCNVTSDVVDVALPWSPDSDRVVISIENDKKIKVNGLDAELLDLSLSQIDQAMQDYIEYQRSSGDQDFDGGMGLYYEIIFYSGSLLVDGNLVIMSIAERICRDNNITGVNATKSHGSD